MLRTLLSTLFILTLTNGYSTEFTCPIVSNTSQSFCSSEGTGNNFHAPRVSDLTVLDGGEGISWFESSSAIEPLGDGHLLESGKQYFADNALGTCGSRIAVNVTINDAPNAGATTFVSFCSNANAVDLLTLYNPSILGPPDPGGIFLPALASGTTIFDPALDRAGQYKYVVSSASGSCPTDYAIIYVSIKTAPNAGENANISISSSSSPIDLFTVIGDSPDPGGTWNPALSSGSGIFDPNVDNIGEYSYTVKALNSCEDSAIVTISMFSDPPPAPCPIVSNNSQIFCSSEGTGNNFHKPRISDLNVIDAGGGVAWYDSSLSTVPLSNDHVLETGMQYYADNLSGTCGTRVAVMVTINDAPNAGSTSFVTLCSNADAVDLLTKYKPSLLGSPDPGGVFIPALASGTTIFDPAIDKAGRYKYMVSSPNGLCPTDYSVIYITVENCKTEQMTSNEISLYPNPSYGIFELKKPNDTKFKFISIFDFNGKKIKEYDLNIERNLTVLDLSNLKSGIYFAEFKTSQGRIVKKLIKN